MSSHLEPRTRQYLGVVITALVLGLNLTSSAYAQTRQPRPASPPQTTTLVPPSHWTVTPFVGFGFSGDLDSATGALGAAGGYVWSDRVSLEGEFNFLPSSEAGGLIEVDTRVWSLTGNLLYHFAGRRMVPYGVIGLGFGHGSADLNNSTVITTDTSSTNFVVNFGGGVEHRIAKRAAVRGDLRYFFGGDLVPDFWRLSAGINFDVGRR
jgi:opacity protein-like surface antigen